MFALDINGSQIESNSGSLVLGLKNMVGTTLNKKCVFTGASKAQRGLCDCAV